MFRCPICGDLIGAGWSKDIFGYYIDCCGDRIYL